MTATPGSTPTFAAVEGQMHALADVGVPMWRKHERVDLQLLLRVPAIASSLAPLSTAGDPDSDSIWKAVEDCIKTATAKLRQQDFGPAALDSFGLRACPNYRVTPICCQVIRAKQNISRASWLTDFFDQRISSER